MDPLQLPRKIVLPFGYVVTVKLVPPKDPLLRDAETGEYDDGCWYDSERWIVLNKALPPKKKRYIFTHELAHCLVDYQHDLFLRGRAKPTGGS